MARARLYARSQPTTLGAPPPSGILASAARRPATPTPTLAPGPSTRPDSPGSSAAILPFQSFFSRITIHRPEVHDAIAKYEASRSAGVDVDSESAGWLRREFGDLSLVPGHAAVPPPRMARREVGGEAHASGETLRRAALGVRGAGEALPHARAIQESFGRHDVGGIVAHVGGPAASAAESVGARAYAMGDQIAFRSSPDLRTAAHEAAHVIQQRAGRRPRGGVGAIGDVLERHADAVAERVARGQRAEALLDWMPAGRDASRGAAVQRTPITESTDTGNTYTQDLNVYPHSVIINLAVDWKKTGTWHDEAAFRAFVREVKAHAYSYLDWKFKIVGTPKTSGRSAPPPLSLPIAFLLSDKTGGYPINVWGGTHGTTSMATAGGNIYALGLPSETALPFITPAHEFGHALLGASDEYANPAMPHRVLTNDHSIMANFYQQGIARAEFKVRHFQHILAEVAKQFPNHTCTLVKM